MVKRCRICGCTDADCSECIAISGAPCWWVSDDLCSLCADIRDCKIFPGTPEIMKRRVALFLEAKP